MLGYELWESRKEDEPREQLDLNIPGVPSPLGSASISPRVAPLPANGTPASVYRVLGYNFIHWENTHSFSFPVLKFRKGRGIGSTWVKTPPLAHSVVAWGWGLTKAL